MHQTRKGKQRYLGMKAHVGGDRKTKAIPTAVVTAANGVDSAVRRRDTGKSRRTPPGFHALWVGQSVCPPRQVAGHPRGVVSPDNFWRGRQHLHSQTRSRETLNFHISNPNGLRVQLWHSSRVPSLGPANPARSSRARARRRPRNNLRVCKIEQIARILLATLIRHGQGTPRG
jgi:hypothetical protein